MAGNETEGEILKKSDVDFLSVAQNRYARLFSQDEHNLEQARENLRFVYEIDEGQWDQEDRDHREKDGRPCLTSGQLRKFVAGVANQERDQRIAGPYRRDHCGGASREWSICSNWKR